jgi:hypothetical protein
MAARRLNPLGPVRQNDDAQSVEGRMAMEKRSRSIRQRELNVQMHRFVLAVMLALAVLLLVSLFVKPGADWIYYGHDGLPVPCPPPKRGIWPRDCP